MNKNIAALVFISSSAFAADRTITIDNPDAMYGPTEGRTVNCDNLKIINKKPELTCKFAVEVDGQQICKDDDPRFSKMTEEMANTSKYLTIMEHQATKHGQCIVDYGQAELDDLKIKYATAKAEGNKAGMDALEKQLEELKTEIIDLDEQWGHKNQCAVIEALQQCRATYNLDLN